MTQRAFRNLSQNGAALGRAEIVPGVTDVIRLVLHPVMLTGGLYGHFLLEGFFDAFVMGFHIEFVMCEGEGREGEKHCKGQENCEEFESSFIRLRLLSNVNVLIHHGRSRDRPAAVAARYCGDMASNIAAIALYNNRLSVVCYQLCVKNAVVLKRSAYSVR